MSAQQEQIQTEVIDGYIIDIESGEILGLAQPEFHVTDEDSANWVLEKIMDEEVDMVRLETKLKALQENIQSQIQTKQRRAEWLRMKFGPELEQFARKQLEGQKAKTLKMDYGQLSLRTVKGGLRVKDADAALMVAKLRGWDNAIKVKETFQISGLTDEQKEAIGTAGSVFSDEAQAFEIKPDSETFTVKTGVKL